MFRDSRTDLRQWLGCYVGKLAGVDLTCNPTPSHERLKPGSPLSRLRSVAAISRDFRDAGKGGEFDRLAKYSSKVYGGNGDKSRAQSRGVLEWRNVSTIVLHTAGIAEPRHTDPTSDTIVMRPDRWLGVPCHNAVAADDTIVLCHELNAYLWAAHAANRYSCSMEIAGNGTITEKQIVAARALLTYNVDELRTRRPRGADGQVLPVYIAPHRFSHRSRSRDCGAAIWEAVGEWGIRELGLLLGPVVGSGKPLPWPT